MIEVDGNKVQCPNCKELLANVAIKREGATIKIFWFHQYENFCMDVFEEEYYKANSTNNYFTVLKTWFNIDLEVKEVENDNNNNK